MPKYLETKDGSLESAVLEAVSPAQQAAIAISKKKKAGKPGYDDKGKSLKNDAEQDEGNAFGAALQAAKENGDDTFVVGGKTFKVKDEEKKLKEKLVGGQKKLDKDKDGDIDGKDFAMMRKAKKEEVELKEKPADYLELEFNSSRDAAKAYDYINNKLYPTGNQPFNIQPNEGSSLQFEDMDDADKVMAELKKARFKFKVYERESVQEETLAQATARAISDMWSEASKSPKKEEEEEMPKKKKEAKKTTMTGKPMNDIVVMPKSKEE